MLLKLSAYLVSVFDRHAFGVGHSLICVWNCVSSLHCHRFQDEPSHR